MPKRPCKVCLRPDASLLLETVQNGASVRSVALRHDIHPRVLLQHLERHTNGAYSKGRGYVNSAKTRAKLSGEISVLAESKALLDRVKRILAEVSETRSHATALTAVREAKGLLDLIGRASGELSPQSANSVSIVLGVNVEQAKAAVASIDHADALSPSEAALEAVAYLEEYLTSAVDSAVEGRVAKLAGRRAIGEGG